MARAEVISDMKMVLDYVFSSRNAYLNVLDTISKFHKYSYEQQLSLSLYAGSDYSAVADERVWTQVFHANINLDANGIEILDKNSPDGVKIVYDASDTNLPAERREKLLWRFNSERDIGVFRGIADEGSTPIDSIFQLCWRLEDDPLLAESSLSGDDILLISESVGYVLMKRLGYDHEADLFAQQTISDESFSNSNIQLDIVSDVSREILNGVQDYIQKGKGRGADFPLEEVMARVHEIIFLREEEVIEERQENSAVEASATEAADATKEAAEPEEAVASPAPPAQDTATEAEASVAADDVLGQGSLFDVNTTDNNAGESAGAENKEAESAVSDPAVRAEIQQDNALDLSKYIDASIFYLSKDGRYISEANPERQCRVRVFLYEGQKLGCMIENPDYVGQLFVEDMRDAHDKIVNLSSTFAPEADPEIVTSSVIENYRALLNRESLAYAHPSGGDTHEVRILAKEDYAALGISYDDQQENSAVEASVNEAKSEPKAVTEPKETDASPVPPAQDTATNGTSVAADDKPFDIPVIADRRRFDMSPDGLELVEFSHTSDPNVWGTQSTELPENFITVSMEYMTNGRIDVTIFNSVTEDEKSFSAFGHEELMNSGREVFAEMLPAADDADLVMLSSRLLTHAMVMERRVNAFYRDHQPVPPLDEEKEYADFMESYSKEQQENSTVEASVDEAEAAPKAAAEPEVAVTSPASPAQNTATDGTSVAVGDNDLTEHSAIVDTRKFHISPKGRIINRGNSKSLTVNIRLLDDGQAYLSIDSNTGHFGSKVFSPQDAYDMTAFDRNVFHDFDLSILAASVKDQYIDMLRVNNIAISEQQESLADSSSIEEAVVSSAPAAQDTATDGTSVAADDVVLDDSRDVVASRLYYISSDGKRSNKPKSSMLRVEVDLRGDGAAYIDIATHNGYSGTGVLADDPQDAYDFALGTNIASNFDSKVLADAILSDYQEMMREHNIQVPVVVDQRRFEASPDGVEILEYTHDPDSDRWSASEPSPENHVRVMMRYMSNGRVDVGISNSVTDQTSNFTDYDNLYNTARAIFGDIVPDGNPEMLANWVVQHSILMERRARSASNENLSVSPVDEAKEWADFMEEQRSRQEEVAPAKPVDERKYILSSKGNYVERYTKGSASISVTLMDDESLEVRFLDDPDHSAFRVKSFDEAFSISKLKFSELLVSEPSASLVAASVEGQYRDMLRLYRNDINRQQEGSPVEAPAAEAEIAPKAAAEPKAAEASPEAPAAPNTATDGTSVAGDNDTGSDNDDFVDIRLEDYFALAGVQVIPDWRKEDILAAWEQKRASGDTSDRGKFVVIEGINLDDGRVHFTAINNIDGVCQTVESNNPDYVLHFLDVDMEAFRDAVAKFDDGVSLEEAALPSNNPPIRRSADHEEDLIYSPFLTSGASSDMPKKPTKEEATEDNGSSAPSDEAPASSGNPKYHGGKKGEAFQRNIKAIQVLKTLEQEDRSFNDKMEEFALLDYSGFGNLSEVFDESNESWKAERDLLKSVLSNEEYIAARSSVLSAFYTDPDIVSAIYRGITKMGFTSGNILEPSCGTGHFFYDMPGFLRDNSHLFGVELDLISGRIARKLHPDAEIAVQGFESTSFPDGSFDLTITNVPFENYKIEGRSVHDYFLLKMAQQTRPGGLMVAITSRYSMDKKDSSSREDLARMADLVKAIRLPNTAFREAGAEATTDILVFRRREKDLDYNDALPSWVRSVPFKEDSSINVNPYFLQHPEDVIGTLEEKSTAYGFDLTCKPKEDVKNTADIAAEITKSMSSIRSEFIPLANPLPVPEQKQNDNATPYSFFVRGDEVFFRDADSSAIKSLSDLGIDEKDKGQIMQLIRIRDLTREVIRSQQFTDNDDALHAAQERMNSVYQDYVKTYGDLHNKKVKQIFEQDCSYPLLLSLEITDSKGKVTGLSDIFTKRTIRPHIPPTHVDTAQEALIVSMTEQGRVDLGYMERLSGLSMAEITEELEYKELFWNETEASFQSADEYLSGDIRAKMEYLEKRKEFTKDQMDRDIWDSLIPALATEDDREYTPKNDIEERILRNNTSYSFSSEASEYMEKEADKDFCFAFLKMNDGNRFYRLPDRIKSDPLFCLEAALFYGTNIESNDAVILIKDIVNSFGIEGLNLEGREWSPPVFEFLHDGSEREYPQKRAVVQYLRELLKDYDGINGEELVERAGKEWPRIWQEWQDKYTDTLEKAELFGLSEMKNDLERIDKNYAALKEVCPKDLQADEISVRLGAPWIPPSDIERFMDDVFGDYRTVEYSDVHHGQWKIASSRSRRGLSEYNEKAKEFSTPEFDASALLEKILNLQMAVVKDKVYVNGQEKEVVNQEKTVLAQQKQEMIKDAFSKWIWQDEKRKDRLVKYYNRYFNNIRPREYDGSHLVFPGMNPEIQLRSHQKDAIAHTLYGGNTLLAHCVGAGKSFEMIASIMESKRLGLSSKAMLVVPGHLTEQMGAEFLRLYPTANILVATKKDFEKANRKEFCAKIATHNWDAVILGFTQFEKVAMSKEYTEDFLKSELSRISNEIEVAAEKDGKSFSVRQLERLRKNLEAKLKALQDKKPKDDVINFEDLGIDRLYVDEAHNFKNLGVITKLQRMPGINTESAQKSSDFYQKVQYINNKTNSKGLVFATGTAISNSMTELYVMQQYLQPDRLESEGLRHFDTWATTFGEIATVQELAPEGKGIRPRQRFSKFGNLPELMSMVKEFADIKTEDMLDLPTPNVEYHVESVPASPEQKAMVDELADRAVAIRNKNVDTSLPENNMLSVTNEGRKLALDQRLLNPGLPDYPDSKVNRCVSNVFRIWEETKKNKGTQLVFSDFSTPDKDRFNVYDDIKEKLIAKGVPADEIAFIHDANNEKQKEELFAKVRAGKVRVLLGSTGKLGTGTNVQDKLVASHDLDVPWKPSDLEQRKGRIARQGNENEKVDVYRYVTEGTFDSYMWQILENKQRFISQILTSKTPARVTEDADELVLTCAEVKAIATGSPLIREKLELDVEVERLKIARKGFLAEQTARKKFIEVTAPQRIEACKKDKVCAEADAETMKSFVKPEDGTLIILGGKRFTDEKEAGEAIVKAIKAGAGTELTGSYKGMKFSLSPGFNWRMNLTGKMSYSEDVHMGNFVENFKRLVRMEEEIAAYPAKMDDEIKKIEKNLEEAIEFSTHPFPREDEYQQKLLRLQELTVLLSEENSQDKAFIAKEEERRVEFLLSNTEASDEVSELTAAYANIVVINMKETPSWDNSSWSEEKDQALVEYFLREGYDAAEISEVLLKCSPKIYDAPTVDRIVSQAKASVKDSGNLSAAR